MTTMPKICALLLTSIVLFSVAANAPGIRLPLTGPAIIPAMAEQAPMADSVATGMGMQRVASIALAANDAAEVSYSFDEYSQPENEWKSAGASLLDADHPDHEDADHGAPTDVQHFLGGAQDASGWGTGAPIRLAAINRSTGKGSRPHHAASSRTSDDNSAGTGPGKAEEGSERPEESGVPQDSPPDETSENAAPSGDTDSSPPVDPPSGDDSSGNYDSSFPIDPHPTDVPNTNTPVSVPEPSSLGLLGIGLLGLMLQRRRTRARAIL